MSGSPSTARPPDPSGIPEAVLTGIEAHLRQRELRREEIYQRARHQMHYRARGEVYGLLAGYELVRPGLVDMIRWRPDPDAGLDPLGGDVTRYSGYAAVGRNPEPR